LSRRSARIWSSSGTIHCWWFHFLKKVQTDRPGTTTLH
jgi:hypothetical protein